MGDTELALMMVEDENRQGVFRLRGFEMPIHPSRQRLQLSGSSRLISALLSAIQITDNWQIMDRNPEVELYLSD